MRILVLGCDGLLGQAFSRIYVPENGRAICYNREACDITKTMHVARLVRDADDDGAAVVNCATAGLVDEAEKNPEKNRRVAVWGGTLVAEACKEMGVPYVYVSSDFVFRGDQ